MKKTLIVLWLLLLGFSKSFAQETSASTDGTVRLIRSGLNFYHEGDHPMGGMNLDHSFSILMPSYTQLGRRIYFSCPIPSVSISDANGAKFGYFNLQPALGVVFLKQESRIRPFIAGVLGFEAQRQSFKNTGFFGSNISYREWRTVTALELRIGAFYRLTSRIWMDLTIDAPTGHSLYQIRTTSGSDATSEVFNNSYDTYLPKVQLGVSYQIR